MKRWALAMWLTYCSTGTAFAACIDMGERLEKACRIVVDTYDHGDNTLLLSGYTWHLPWSYSAERRAQENANAWGGGWARTLERPNGDSDIVYFLAFEDSHKAVQLNLGYAWLTYWGERENVQPGLGYTAFIMQRPDIASGIPIPAVLPVFALRYQKFTLLTSYVPTLNAGVNHGSVLYVFGSITLDGK